MTIRAEYEGGNVEAAIEADSGIGLFTAVNTANGADVGAAFELTIAWGEYARGRDSYEDGGYLSPDDELADWLGVVCGRDAVKVETTKEERKAAEGRVY